jgi:repressor LexA
MRTANPLTEQDVLSFLQAEERAGRPMPTLREIARHMGHRTTLSVQRILDRLEAANVIERAARKSRGIRLTEQARLPRGLLLLGQIAAGPLTDAIENPEFFDLGEAYDSDRHRGLRVRGDSMIEAHILDGDIAVIRLQSTCHDNEIVAALCEGEATLKRLVRRKDHILLKPENKTMKPIRVSNVEILGVMVGLIRKCG